MGTFFTKWSPSALSPLQIMGYVPHSSSKPLCCISRVLIWHEEDKWVANGWKMLHTASISYQSLICMKGKKLAWISIGKTLPVSCYKSLCFSDAGKKDALQTDGSNCLVTEASNSKETSYQGSNCSTNTEHWWSEWFHCKCWRTVKKLLWINHSKAPKLRSPKFGQRCDQVLEKGYILNLC